MKTEKKAPTGPSPARKLFDTVRAGTTKLRSWRDVNTSRQEALHLAVKFGFRFGKKDIAYFQSLGGQHWLHLESMYALAVEANNVSACQAFETYFNRPPFIFSRKRLGIGSSLIWNGRTVKVTSFNRDHNGPYVTLCSYKKKVAGQPEKVDRISKVTVAELKKGEPKENKSKPELALRRFVKAGDELIGHYTRKRALAFGTLKAFWESWTEHWAMKQLLANVGFPISLAQAYSLNNANAIRIFVGDFDTKLKPLIEAYCKQRLKKPLKE